MKTIYTLGGINQRTLFDYEGNHQDGFTIHFHNSTNQFHISSTDMLRISRQFENQQVAGGFSMTNPSKGGVGEFVQSLGINLTPRHASFICAIMVYEGLAASWLEGNAVWLMFPSLQFVEKRVYNRPQMMEAE